MRRQLPIGLAPLMGFMLWRITHGDTPEHAREAAEHHKDYTGFSADEYTAAMEAASFNAAATDAAYTLTGSDSIGAAIERAGEHGRRG